MIEPIPLVSVDHRYPPRQWLFGPGPTERRGRENPLRHAGTLLGGLHPGPLRPRDHLYAEAGGEHGGQFPLRYSPALIAPNSGLGHGLGQTGVAKTKCRKKCTNKNKAAEIR